MARGTTNHCCCHGERTQRASVPSNIEAAIAESRSRVVTLFEGRKAVNRWTREALRVNLFAGRDIAIQCFPCLPVWMHRSIKPCAGPPKDGALEGLNC